MEVQTWFARAQEFEYAAHRILGAHEAAPSRVVLLDATYSQLDVLTVKQDDLFRQALRCAENGLYRAAYVMCWAAFMDFLEELAGADGFVRLRSARPRWSITSLNDLRENYPESQIVDALKDAGILTKNDAKAFQGMLNARNECAHPSDYYPDLNTTLGYLSEALKRLSGLQKRAASKKTP